MSAFDGDYLIGRSFRARYVEVRVVAIKGAKVECALPSGEQVWLTLDELDGVYVPIHTTTADMIEETA